MEVKTPLHGHGVALVEIVMSVMLVTLMLTIMVPAALRLIEEAREDKAVTQLEEIQAGIDEFQKIHSRFPLSLIELYSSIPLDPWGNPYQYLNIADSLHKGKQRKYKGTVSINTDYDLYSMGPDGESVPPLTGSPSHDDIIRGNNGRYLGRASDFGQ